MCLLIHRIVVLYHKDHRAGCQWPSPPTFPRNPRARPELVEGPATNSLRLRSPARYPRSMKAAAAPSAKTGDAGGTHPAHAAEIAPKQPPYLEGVFSDSGCFPDHPANNRSRIGLFHKVDAVVWRQSGLFPLPTPAAVARRPRSEAPELFLQENYSTCSCNVPSQLQIKSIVFRRRQAQAVDCKKRSGAQTEGGNVAGASTD